MLALHEANRANGSWHDARSLEIAPNLWSGVGLVRGGAGTALVGSHTDVADRIAEYAEIGIDEFIFSGYPHLEELFWFGEGVVPILRERGLFDGRSSRRGAGLDPVRRRREVSARPPPWIACRRPVTRPPSRERLAASFADQAQSPATPTARCRTTRCGR